MAEKSAADMILHIMRRVAVIRSMREGRCSIPECEFINAYADIAIAGCCCLGKTG